MVGERISSKLYIERTKELERFEKFLKPESTSNIFSIHTNGMGGIGKTLLLWRMQDYCASIADKVVFTKQLIDFYHTESRSKLGVIRQLVNELGAANFPEFVDFIRQYEETQDASERERLLPHVEKVFQKDYARFASQTEAEKKCIVLFFDISRKQSGLAEDNDLAFTDSDEAFTSPDVQLQETLEQIDMSLEQVPQIDDVLESMEENNQQRRIESTVRYLVQTAAEFRDWKDDLSEQITSVINQSEEATDTIARSFKTVINKLLKFSKCRSGFNLTSTI